MPALQRRREYRDTPDESRWDGVLGATFIFASAVIVAKLAEFQFDRFFYAAALIAAVLFIVSKSRLAYLAAALAWMGLRLLGAGALARKWWAFALGAVFAAVAYWLIMIAAERDEFERITKAWRR